MTSLDGQVALVTGSSRGIGAAIATLFAQHGARVVIHGRDVDALAAVGARIASTGAEVFSTTADLTEHGQVEAMRLAIEEHVGPVDILVANGGGSPVPPSPIEDITEADW
jgi:3-oxoacyl-[acyl-carrier protein] reductase